MKKTLHIDERILREAKAACGPITSLMVLIDTSVWIATLKGFSSVLVALLEAPAGLH
jgi:hypothetical protein